MNLSEAEHLVKDCALDVEIKGSAAPAPNMSEFMMATLLVIDNLLDRVSNLEVKR